MTMEEQSMKKSIGKKLLAGIVSASMILGIPVSGYSQEEETQPAVIAAEESVDVTEAVLAGAGEEADIAAEAVEAEASEVQAEEDAVFDVSEEDTDAAAEAEDLLAAAEEDAEEEAPEDGIILEAAEEEALEAAEDETPVVPVEVQSEDELRTAIQHAAENGVIKLTKDITCSNAVKLMDVAHMLSGTTTLTIDLGNHKLDVSVFAIGEGKTLNLKNGQFIGDLEAAGGTVNLPTGITVTGEECLFIHDGGTVNLNGGLIDSSVSGSSMYAVFMRKGTLNISGDSAVRASAADRGGLYLEDKDAVVKMTDGNILIEEDTAYYAASITAGSMIVSGGRITSKKGCGIGVASKNAAEVGSFSITKGIITTKKNTIEVYRKGQVSVAGEKGGQGTASTTQLISETGYAIDDEFGSDSDSSISVTGGYLEGDTVPIFSNNNKYYKDTDRATIVKVSTDAVGFNSSMNDWREYLPSVNCRTKKNSSGVFVIYTLNANNAAACYIRKSGAVYYTETVQEAMDVIGKPYSPKNGDTVKLYRDVKEEDQVIVSGINREIDLNGHLLKTKLGIDNSEVKIRNSGSAGFLEAYDNGFALVLEDGANVTLEKTLTIKAPGSSAVSVGGNSSDTCKLTVNGTITALEEPIDIYAGNNEVNITSAKLSADSGEKGTGLWIRNSADKAVVTVKNSTITGGYGISAYAGELTISGSTVTGQAEPSGNPHPGSTICGTALDIDGAKLTVTSGTFTSKYAHAMCLDSIPAGSEVSGGTFKSGQADWDAVAGTPVADMFTGGTYYPNTKNDMKAGVKTAEYALVGVTGGTFYVGKYKEVVPALYKANASATKLTVGAAAKSTLLYGFKAHAAILNLTGEDIDVLIGTDDTVAANKKTLPKTADSEAWVFHNDLVELKAAVNKEATCTLPAVSADCWYCETLKKAYKAADAKEECDPGTITAAAKGHTWSAWNANGDRTCSVCGKKEHDATKVQPKYQISGYPKKLKAKAAGGRKLTVSWKKPIKSKLKKIKGVQIQVATDKNFTNIVKTKKVKKTKTSFTFKKLKKGQKYYVRVRFYKGSQISKWSPVKSRKVK